MNTYTASISITLRSAILDVQGKTVEHALHALHMPALGNVRIGKHIQLDVQAVDVSSAENLVHDACKQLLANPVMEDYSFTLSPTKAAQ
jgi:phosphoribosylformylglycinamidine synthase subunit PurS